MTHNSHQGQDEDETEVERSTHVYLLEAMQTLIDQVKNLAVKVDALENDRGLQSRIPDGRPSVVLSDPTLGVSTSRTNLPFQTPCARALGSLDEPRHLTSTPRSDSPLCSTIPINQINPPKFNGERSQARAWLRDYENTMKINHYPDSEKLTRAEAYLSGEATQWLSLTKCLDPNLTWEGFKTAFVKHFCGIDAQAEFKKKLADNKQKPSEHPLTYLARTVDLYLQYKPDTCQEKLVKCVISGLRDDVCNNLSTKPQSEWTISWLREVFEVYKSPHREPRGSPEKTLRSMSTQENPKLERDLSTWICFNCNNEGHLLEHCPEPQDFVKIGRRKEEYKQQKSRNANTEDLSIVKESGSSNVCNN